MTPKPKIENQLVMIIGTGTIVVRSAVPIADCSLRPGQVYAPEGLLNKSAFPIPHSPFQRLPGAIAGCKLQNESAIRNPQSAIES